MSSIVFSKKEGMERGKEKGRGRRGGNGKVKGKGRGRRGRDKSVHLLIPRYARLLPSYIIVV